jgi:hypothetical protein
LSGIFLCEEKCFGGDIDTEVSVLGLSAGECEWNGSSAGADVDDKGGGLIL